MPDSIFYCLIYMIKYIFLREYVTTDLCKYELFVVYMRFFFIGLNANNLINFFQHIKK